MPEKNIIEVSINPTWDIVKDINDKVKDILVNSDGDEIEAITMVITELVENGVKYGERTEGCAGIDFKIDVVNDVIKITVANGVKTRGNAEVVIEHIEKIKKSNDPAQLYTERLMELMEHPEEGGSQLGLYRIGYEGGFDLDCTYENSVLKIIASKKLDKPVV